MDNILTIIVIGIYTLIYVVVFLVQKSQLNSQKEIIQSMKSFMEVFKIEEVKKYVDLKEENMQMESDKFISEKEKEIKETIIKSYIDLKKDEIKEIFFDTVGNEIVELTVFASRTIKMSNLPKEQKIELIERLLPKTKSYIFKALDF